MQFTRSSRFNSQKLPDSALTQGGRRADFVLPRGLLCKDGSAKGYRQTLTIRSTGTTRIKTCQPRTGTRLGPVIPKSTAQIKNRRDRVTPLRSRSDGSHYPDQPVSGASDRSRLSHDLRPCPRLLPSPCRSTAEAPRPAATKLAGAQCPRTNPHTDRCYTYGGVGRAQGRGNYQWIEGQRWLATEACGNNWAYNSGMAMNLEL